jgi:hypothetical protein
VSASRTASPRWHADGPRRERRRHPQAGDGPPRSGADTPAGDAAAGTGPFAARASWPPSPGTLSDYAYGRYVADPSLRKTYGYTFETAPGAGNVRDSFHPPDPEPVEWEAESRLLALAQQCI